MAFYEFISYLGPGDKFIYKDREYLLIKTTPADFGFSSLSNHSLAVSLDTFEIVLFDNDWEVEIVYYQGG